MEHRNYSLVFRVMHWAIALCMILLLFTVFLRLNWMNKDFMAGIIQNFLTNKDVSLSKDETVALAKQIRKPMWEWHIYLGYALSCLIGLRLILPFFREMKFANPFRKGLSAKTKFQYAVYLVFYICIVITLATGLIMELGPKTLKKPMEEIHVLALYYVIPFLILHLGGVILAEISSQPGIISRMVNGKKS